MSDGDLKQKLEDAWRRIAALWDANEECNTKYAELLHRYADAADTIAALNKKLEEKDAIIQEYGLVDVGETIRQYNALVAQFRDFREKATKDIETKDAYIRSILGTLMRDTEVQSPGW